MGMLEGHTEGAEGFERTFSARPKISGSCERSASALNTQSQDRLAAASL